MRIRDFLADAIEFGAKNNDVDLISMVGSVIGEDDLDGDIEIYEMASELNSIFGDIPESFSRFVEETYGEYAIPDHPWNISLEYANDLRSIIYSAEGSNKLWALLG